MVVARIHAAALVEDSLWRFPSGRRRHRQSFPEKLLHLNQLVLGVEVEHTKHLVLFVANAQAKEIHRFTGGVERGGCGSLFLYKPDCCCNHLVFESKFNASMVVSRLMVIGTNTPDGGIPSG